MSIFCNPKPSFFLSEMDSPCRPGGRRLPHQNSAMQDLNKLEAEALQLLLNGERLWCWPDGRVQLGQSFPDLSVISSLMRQGLLDQAYEPTEAGLAAFQSWRSSIGLPATPVIRTSDAGPRPRLATDQPLHKVESASLLLRRRRRLNALHRRQVSRRDGIPQLRVEIGHRRR